MDTTLFWTGIFIIFYSYLGYGIVLTILTKIPKLRYIFKMPEGYGNILINPKIGYLSEEDNLIKEHEYQPTVTLLVAAYNEKNIIAEKIENCRALDYPKDKLEILFVTDGSDDGTLEMLKQYSDVTVYHRPERKGKIAAVNRTVPLAKGEILVFSDANSMFNPESIKKLVRHFRHNKVGCVAGEKRVIPTDKSTAGEGEGFYWKYESYLKRKDSELFSVVGAAGEIFAIRKNLFQPVAEDSIIEDFVLSLSIAANGYRVIYEPEAISFETPSVSVSEEFKRKARISAGGFQAMLRLKHLVNIKKYGLLTFQYISHRVLRWAVVPPLFVLVLLTNINLVLFTDNVFYQIILLAQGLFYLFGFLGWIFENKNIKIKIFSIPFYLMMMNYAVFVGFYRFLANKQKVTWERASR